MEAFGEVNLQNSYVVGAKCRILQEDNIFIIHRCMVSLMIMQDNSVIYQSCVIYSDKKYIDSIKLVLLSKIDIDV